MSEKQEIINKLLEMQKKFIDFEHQNGVEMEDYFVGEEGHALRRIRRHLHTDHPRVERLRGRRAARARKRTVDHLRHLAGQREIGLGQFEPDGFAGEGGVRLGGNWSPDRTERNRRRPRRASPA